VNWLRESIGLERIGESMSVARSSVSTASAAFLAVRKVGPADVLPRGGGRRARASVGQAHGPEPFLDGAADITKIVAENTVKPIADVPGQVASEAAKQTNCTVAVVSALCVIGVLFAIWIWIKHQNGLAKAKLPFG
jgi:hypothetical protein